DQAGLGSSLFRRAVARQLDIEPVGKSRSELGEHSFGGFGLPFRKQPPNRTLRPAREAEEALTGASQVRAADRGLAQRFSSEIGLANQPEKISVPRLVLNQKHDPVRFR